MYHSSIFKTIQNDGDSFITNLKNTFLLGFNGIFTAIKQQSFSFDTGFTENLDRDINALQQFGNAIRNNVDPIKATEQYLVNASQSAKKYSDQIKNGTGDIARFTIQQKQLQVTSQAQDRTFTNCKSIITEYNSALNSANHVTQNTGLTQTEFTSAIGQSNGVLGRYLTSLNGSQASLTGYIKNLITAKAATIGLKAVTTAANMAFMAVISYGISKAAQGISYLINYQKNIAKATKEAAIESKNQVNAYQENIDTVDELIVKYKELKETYDNSDKTDDSVKSEILDIQSQINDITSEYRDKIDLVNGGLEEQLNILKQIRSEETSDLLDQAIVNYQNAKESSQKAFLTDDKDYDIKLKLTDEDKKFLDNNGWKRYVNDDGFWVADEGTRTLSNLFTGNTELTFSNSNDARGKLNQIEELIDKLKNQMEDYQSSELYKSLVNAKSSAEEYVKTQENAANYLLNALLDVSFDGLDINNVGSINDIQKIYDILSDFTSANSTQSPPVSDGNLKLFISKAVNIIDNTEHTIVLQANNDSTSYKFSDMHTARESSQKMALGTSAATTKPVPAFSYQYPLRCTSVYQKLQSQAQYGKMQLNGKSFISGSCFAVKYEEGV